MAASADQSKPYIPHNNGTGDGWTKDDEATATCYCGAVQMVVPIKGPGLVDVFVCNCTDCRKITASMFATNFTVNDKYVRFVRGQDNLKSYAQDATTVSGKTMTNYFCSTCGTLMSRVGAKLPGYSFLRLGTVDDFNLHETLLRPRTELFTKDRVSWFTGVEGTRKYFSHPGADDA